MTELSPQLTYSIEDGVLEINTTLDSGVRDGQMEVAAELGQLPGVEIVESDGVLNSRVEILQTLGDSFHNQGDYEIGHFIHKTYQLMFADRQDTDKVVGIKDWFHKGAKASIYPSFQRWLNTDNLDDSVARETFVAMATPFGDEYVQKARQEYQAYGDVHSAWSFGLGVSPSRFGLYKSEVTDEHAIETVGEVSWGNLNMQTIGDCTCWGVTGEARGSIYIRDERPELYAMTPHNWDYARESLSLVLGIGVLARHAAEYSGTEDILAGAQWQEPRIIPL